MLKTIQTWLANPKRSFADGLAIFETAASDDIKKKYLQYFKDNQSEAGQFDQALCMLTNKVAAIEMKIKISPDQFKDMTLVITGSPVAGVDEIAAKENEIAELKATIEALTAEKSEVDEENSDLTDNVEELESEIEDHVDALSEAETLLEEKEAELTALKERRGLSIVAYDNLPEDIKKLYDRVKVITPEMASFHADISVEKLHIKTRESLVKKLVKLDDERRAAWDTIDEWSEGKTVEPVLEKPAYSENVLVAGAQIVRRIERLKENLVRSQATADSSEREVVKANAVKRIEVYTAELAELEAKLQPEGEKPKDDETTV